MRRAAVAALLLCASCSDLVVGRGAPTDRGAVFDDLWAEVDRRYPFLDYKGIDWVEVGARYRPMALAAANDTLFADVLASMLAELRDVHVTLTPFGPGSLRRYVAPSELRSTYYDPSTTAAHVAGFRATTGGHLAYGMAAADVGYVRIATFTGGSWAGEMDEALRGLPGARTLLVDVRDNTGGSRPLAIEIAGRFARETTVFSYLRFRDDASHADLTPDVPQTVVPLGAAAFTGAVQVLANRHTVSAGEDFVLAMRALPNVSVVGDTTAGATGGPIPRELASGWEYEISEWIQYTPRHQAFEGVGLAPDVVVQATPADAVARRDPALQRAVLRASVAP